jgi:hypothetical protein
MNFKTVMLKRFLLFILVFFAVTLLYSQPIIQWQKCLGGSNNDLARSIQQTTDGGYIVAGNTSSTDGDVSGNNGSTDCWIVKFDSLGIVQWQKCLGGTDGEMANSIQQTIDRGYIIAGYTASNDSDVSGNHGNGFDFWIVKLDSLGIIQWQKCLGGTSSEGANSIQQTTDGGYIVAGNTGSNNGDVLGLHNSLDFWIVKLDSLGIIQWQKCLGGTNVDDAFSIQQTTDNGYIVAGKSGSNDSDVTGNHGPVGSTDYWVVKLTPAGAIQWQKCFGGTDNDVAYSIQQTTDGGYIVTGSTISNDGDVVGNHGSIDCWVVKLTSTGLIQWQKCLGGTDVDDAFSIQQTTDGGYIVAGSTKSFDGDVTGNHGNALYGDYWVVKLTSTGLIQWQKCLGGTDRDAAVSSKQTTDGGFIVAGYTISNDGDVVGNHGSIDCWVVKLSPFVGIDEIDNSVSLFDISPNPIINSTTISFSLSQKENTSLIIYDITGREIKFLKQSNLGPGEYSISWDITDNNNKRVVDGLYLVTLSAEKEKLTKRIVVIK